MKANWIKESLGNYSRTLKNCLMAGFFDILALKETFFKTAKS